MEELQSTEILDREILEDARKKAQKILKTADDTIKARTAEREKQNAAAIDELTQKYSSRLKALQAEIMAALPVDKRRAKAKRMDELLNQAVKTWYGRLDRGRVLALLQRELDTRTAACGLTAAPEMKAAVHQLSRTEAETLLRSVPGGNNCVIEEADSQAPYPELVLDTAGVRLYASVNKTVEFLLDEKRAELVTALLGEAEISGEE